MNAANVANVASIFVALLCASNAAVASEAGVVVGSKSFTESVVLGELARLAARRDGIALEHRRELGGSRILFQALRHGEIDAYPEYTGTLVHELLSQDASELRTLDGINRALAPLGLRALTPLGFENTYALGLKRNKAQELGLRKISDLARHPGLKLGFSSEFIDREDGWKGLASRYDLAPDWVRGMDHDLAYRALESEEIDVIDLYSTDADIAYYDLATLEDDRAYFPEYNALFIVRLDLAERSPALLRSLETLAGTVSEAAMIAMNARVKIDRETETNSAAKFLGVEGEGEVETRLDRLLATTIDHLTLVAISLSFAIAVAIPLGIAAAQLPALGSVVLAVTGILQTLPSLALFVFMIPLFGIGAAPAVVALFLYSLLPIVRNTHAGLTGIDPALRDSALALGLPAARRLTWIELPLASHSIVAGIKTAAVINIGTATLAALIGAGGYGQPILTGIRLDDTSLILEGAVPAAVLALLAQSAFNQLERWLGWDVSSG